MDIKKFQPVVPFTPHEPTIRTLIFMKTQKIQLLELGKESAAVLHERLWSQVENFFDVIEDSTKVITPSWYTFDAI